MKHAVVLILVVVAAVSHASKSLTHKSQTKRQASAPKDGNGTGNDETIVGRRSQRQRDELTPRSGVSHHTFPGTSKKDVDWDLRPCGHPDGLSEGQLETWIYGLGVWQDDRPRDRKGVTRVEIRCGYWRGATALTDGVYFTRYPLYPFTDGLGTHVPAQYCPLDEYGHKMIVGLKVVTGDSLLGIVTIIPICQAPWERNCPHNQPVELDGISVRAFDWRIHHKSENGWHLSSALMCEEGRALCGISTRYKSRIDIRGTKLISLVSKCMFGSDLGLPIRDSAHNEDQVTGQDPGITSVAMDCCPYPSNEDMNNKSRC